MTTLDEIEKRLEAAQRNADTGFTFIAHAPTDIAHLLRIARAAVFVMRVSEESAKLMRDPVRTGGWDGAERVARHYDRIAHQIREALEASNDQDA
jgi:hypothetical protein